MNKKFIIGSMSIMLAFCLINSMKRQLPVSNMPTKSVIQNLPAINPVWIQCSDGNVMVLPEWKVKQIEELLNLFEQQKGTNAPDNPLVASMCTSDELQLLSIAFDVASQGRFSDFLNNLDSERRNLLINISEKLKSKGMSLLCMTAVFPQEIQQLIGQDLSNVLMSVIMEAPFYSVGKIPGALGRNYVKFINDESLFTVYCIEPRCFIELWDLIENRLLRRQEGGFDFSIVSADKQKKAVIKRLHIGTVEVTIHSADQEHILSKRLFYPKIMSFLMPGVFSPDSNSFMIGVGWDLVKWDLKNDSTTVIYKGQAPIYAIAFNYDGTKLVFSEQRQNSVIILWDMLTNQQICTLDTRDNEFKTIQSLAFSPSGNKIAGAGMRATYIWEVDFSFVNKKHLVPTMIKSLSISQLELLYQLYLAKKSNVQPVLDKKNVEYRAYITLPIAVKDLLNTASMKNVFAQPKIEQAEEMQQQEERVTKKMKL